MSNPYDNSASKSYAPASTKELPKLPYDIFLLVVEAFLESAHAEISSEPASWALYLLREVFFILDYNYDGNETRKKRFRLLRGISQVDLRARRMVNQQFPRFAFMEDKHSGVQKFVHICAKVDLFAISSASCITDSLSPPVKPRFLDMLRVLENVYFVSGDFDLESLGAMPSLKSVRLLMDIEMGPYGHVRPCFAQEQVFRPWQWKAIRECSSIWDKGVRLFVNPAHEWCSWVLAELFYMPATAPKRDQVRIRRFAVGCQCCYDALPPWHACASSAQQRASRPHARC